ncbi:MAG: mandelate racemase/muconate lactonizing enzyme family protein, partial [Lentisphaeria bacterium]|nr:mandelate racemase/muconate lactonizing enzyme family protein [Lentisphaeria bacterium]
RATGEAPASAPFRHGLASILKGLDPLDLEQINAALAEGTAWYGSTGIVRSTIGGVDMALWDIAAKAAGKPLRKLLNEKAVDAVPIYASLLWPDSPDDIADRLAGLNQPELTAFKLGWGPMGQDKELDIKLVSKAREAIGEGTLMIDAGRVWDLQTARERTEQFAPYSPHWLEEPLAPDDYAGYKELSETSQITIACGEFFTELSEFEELTNHCQVPIIQPDLGRVGGYSGMLKIQQMICATATTHIPHSFGTGILRAHSAQYIAAMCPDPLLEYCFSESPLSSLLTRDGMALEGATLTLGDLPGLGVEINEDEMAAFRI